MKTSRSKFSFVLAAGLFVAGYSGVACSQNTEEPSIQFSSPINFKCGEDVSWTTLSNWNGKAGACGQGLLYTVIGQVPRVKEGFIKAKIIVPEDNNKEWAAFNGEVNDHPPIAHFR